ncbi:MAG: transglycosylase SLT domain-containing protein [Tissierellia bacterium]|nr:transglycosylase SLT domain-containing protein [Tissierellia bacterium]MDD4780137.1 transglycosylase SLT domain-containing protein [Tissierellia bacterium]
MKHEKYLTTLLIVCISSYIIMKSMTMTVEAEHLPSVSNTNAIRRDSIIYILRDVYLNEKKLIGYISDISKLQYDDCEFIIRECRKNNLDPFIVLGVIKTESDFNPAAVGESGERGLGQLMDNTAKPIAQNLGYVYDSNKLFDTRYNLKLTITQLSYLNELYNYDINKTLTAYNRGQQGLEDYIAQGRSTYGDSAMSEYSVKVLGFVKGYKEEFVNL